MAWLLGAAVWPIPGWPITPIELAVTIDDLPTTGTLPPGTTRMAIVDQMIDTLRRHAVPGVHGFVNGGQVYDNPELEKILLAWRKGGFLLGNHTFSHLDLNRVGADDFVADIERNESPSPASLLPGRHATSATRTCIRETPPRSNPPSGAGSPHVATGSHP